MAKYTLTSNKEDTSLKCYIRNVSFSTQYGENIRIALSLLLNSYLQILDVNYVRAP